MSFSEKIDEWIKEAETRPASALMILKLIAGRMRDLTERNEELLAENISLENGTRVEEYRRRITHLEYQLALLKKRFGADGELPLTQATVVPEPSQPANLLVYNSRGRIVRFEVSPDDQKVGIISGEMSVNGELPRMLALDAQEDVLLLFTSGRVSTLSVEDIPLTGAERPRNWLDASLPDEPRAGELLAGMAALSGLPLADYILQVSRRGSVKKTLSTMAESVLSNHYLGRGTVQKADQSFGILLCRKKARLALVSAEGRLVVLAVDDLSYAAEERVRLEATDYIIAACLLPDDASLLCLTQTGKLVERQGDDLEVTKSAQTRGQAMIPASRLDTGTRFVGAVATRQVDRLAIMDASGGLGIFPASVVAAAGTIKTPGPFISVAAMPGERKAG